MGDTCANCGVPIGNLEQPHVYRDHIVCAPCHTRLTAPPPQASAPPPMPTPQQAIPYAAVAMPAMPPPMQHMGAVPYREPMVPQVQTIQQTSKVWKIQQLLAALLSIGGVVFACAGFGSVSPGNGNNAGVAAGGFGILMFFGGLVWFIVARIGAWWCHG